MHKKVHSVSRRGALHSAVLGILSGAAARPRSATAIPPATQVISKTNLKTIVSRDQPFVASVTPGTVFDVEVEINVGPGVFTSTSQTSISSATWFGLPKNLATGPIQVVGARIGQMLTLTFHRVAANGLAYIGIRPGGGLLPGWIPREAATMPVKVVEVVDEEVRWGPGHRFAVAPFVGTVGVVPPSGSIRTTAVGASGGNMDSLEITDGTRLSLAVSHPGARLYFADTHAIMGDMEPTLIGLECASVARVSAALSPLPSGMVWPRIETATHLGVIATGDSAEAAARAAYEDLIAWLRARYGFGRNDAYLLAAAVAEARFSVMSYKPYVCVCKVAKDRLPDA